MDTHDIHLPDNHQDIVDRFVAACQADERIVTAFLGGSFFAIANSFQAFGEF
jgi:hypothetical protein